MDATPAAVAADRRTKSDSDRTASWYLDALVAEQKRRLNQDWIRNSVGNRRRGLVLKTDLFEEANGEDRILHDLFPDTRLAVGVDWDTRTVQSAVRRNSSKFSGVVCDVRKLPFRCASLDVVVSTSTLDHFKFREGLADALSELARVLRPDGVLLVTIDNPRNPLYHALRWASRRGWTPFTLGQTVSLPVLEQMVTQRGFRILNTRYLIHNPRVISTLLFLALRRVLGTHASKPIRAFLALFALLDKLPTRPITGCFAAVSAIKMIGDANVRVE